MTSPVDAHRAAIARRLAARHPDIDPAGLTPVGRGLESLVCRARTWDGEDVAVRSPWQRFMCNDNDPSVDGRRLLEQEAAIYRVLATSGVPVPEVLACDTAEEPDVLVTTFVRHDGSTAGRSETLSVLRTLHEAPVEGLPPLIAQEDPDVHRTLAVRMQRRLSVVARLTGEDLGCTVEELLAAMGSAPPRPRLLHMDARPANVLARSGRVAALIDWSNALLGPPELEHARLSEYEGATDAPAADDPPRVLAYRLDTAVMLAVVFLSEAPDPVQARRAVDRVRHLVARVQQEVR